MNKQELSKKLKSDLPGFIWEDRKNIYEYYFLRGQYFVNEFFIDDEHGKSSGYLVIDDCSDNFWQCVFKILKKPEFSDLNNETFINSIVDKEYADVYEKGTRISIEISGISDHIYDFIKKTIIDWMEKCDNLRKSNKNKEVLVLIHPDCDNFNVPCILRDMKCIVGPPKDWEWRLGVMNLKDWNFSDNSLCDLLSDSTGDCFWIDKTDSDELEERSDEAGIDLMSELLKVYPQAQGIKEIFTTDWD